MSLKLYNTRTRSVEKFRPLDGSRVRVYVCGLTPSAEAHLGHARSFLFFDLLRRYLAHLKYDVRFVQNVTDIDDRSIERAKRTGENWHEVVAAYYASFKDSMRALGVRDPDVEPYATAYIPQIVAMIAQLVERGYAYASKDGVYYRVSKFARYGELSHRDIDELEAGSRVEVDEFKDDPLDFALWKFAKPGEPKWPSPWGDGRPGWHIECSAMARALLDQAGAGFDIHGGGADLIFPHHENEIAQSEPLMAQPPMANFWVHGGLLLFDNRKMSKSLGNFEPLQELLRRHDPQAVRLLFLQTGYRKVMNFTEESITAARTTLARLKKTYRDLQTQIGEHDPFDSSGSDLLRRIEAALDDDMNTAVALSELLSFRAGTLGEFLYALDLLGIAPDETWAIEVAGALPAAFMERLHAEFGEQIALNGASPEVAIAKVIEVRMLARSDKDWAASDRIRDGLLRCGVQLTDSKTGETTWQPAE